MLLLDRNFIFFPMVHLFLLLILILCTGNWIKLFILHLTCICTLYMIIAFEGQRTLEYVRTGTHAVRMHICRTYKQTVTYVYM